MQFFSTWKTYQAGRKDDYGACHAHRVSGWVNIINGLYEQAINEAKLFMVERRTNDGDIFQVGDYGAPAHLGTNSEETQSNSPIVAPVFTRKKCYYCRTATTCWRTKSGTVKLSKSLWKCATIAGLDCINLWCSRTIYLLSNYMVMEGGSHTTLTIEGGPTVCQCPAVWNLFSEKSQKKLLKNFCSGQSSRSARSQCVVQRPLWTACWFRDSKTLERNWRRYSALRRLHPFQEQCQMDLWCSWAALQKE